MEIKSVKFYERQGEKKKMGAVSLHVIDTANNHQNKHRCFGCAETIF